MKKLYLISNDKIWMKKRNFNSNNDLDNILSCLKDEYNIELICRKSFKKFNYLINEKFNFCKINNIEEKNMNIFMVSITPFTFFSLLRLTFLGKKFKGFIFLRSDGFLEYKIRYGILGYYFYYIMFLFVKKKLKILSVSNHFTKVKTRNILHPSELTNKWFRKKKTKIKFKTDFLYIGRFKKEKGAHYLTKIFKNNFSTFKLSIIGTEQKYIKKFFNSKNIKFTGPVNDQKKLIDLYDSSKIFILPSYTEGFPKVISEAQARLKPIIIFNEIRHVLNNRRGIFVCKRDEKNIRKTINFIFKNYENIQKMISKNNFYTKDNFKKELLNYTKNEFRN